MSDRDRFGGAWLVTEYVFDPDGTHRGTVSQHRRVEATGDHSMRVTQHCRPSPELANHAMAAFAGEWVFDLAVAGDQRHYLGPDVVGMATQWQPGAMTGRGCWPRFGYEFESYGVMVAPDRQLTGGSFSLAGRSVVDIVGVAAPESAGAAPHLDLHAPRPEPPGGADHPHRWLLRRTVGPMLVAAGWASATSHDRLWAMRDPVGDTGIAITERVDGSDRQVTVVVG